MPAAMAVAIHPNAPVKEAKTAIGARMVMPISKGPKPT